MKWMPKLGKGSRFQILLMCGVIWAIAQGEAMAAIKTQAVSYTADGVTMQGWLAWDDAVQGKRPGVLVVHEWWGHNAYARRRAEDLAALGYTALAVDMYGDGKVAEHPDDAGKFAGAIRQNVDGARARFEAAIKVLHGHETVNPEQTAALGYCFGGGLVLNMARLGVDLDVVGSFHGGLGGVTAGDAANIKGRVGVYHGGADSFISADHVKNFKHDMDAADVDYYFLDFPGVVHSFTNPDADAIGKQFGLNIAYDKLADESSWDHFQLLMKDTFNTDK